MNAHPDFSVVTVCYNSASTLAETLKSVGDQVGVSVEHIVIDGGSTDGTLDLIQKNGKHVSKVISERDKGIYDAMNKGVRLAKGEVVAFLNSDDYYNGPGVLSSIRDIFTKDRCRAVFGDVAYFYTENPEKIVRHYRSDRFSPRRIGWGWVPAHPATFFHRSIYERFGFFKTNYKIAGDFEFLARVFSQENIPYRHIAQPLVKMRMGGISTSGWRHTLLGNKEILQACRENGIETNMIKIYSKYFLKFLELRLS